MSTIKERPILMCGAMVRATLEGRKTQTRRVVVPQPPSDAKASWEWWPDREAFVPSGMLAGFTEEMRQGIRCRYGKVAERLYVRETWRTVHDPGTCREGALEIDYAADGKDRIMDRMGKGRWKPSIHMPRYASRITLEITDVRVERLQAIRHNVEDLEAEGIDLPPDELYPNANRGYKLTTVYEKLWDSLNADRGFGWDKNPWVWTITFQRIK